MKSLSWIKERCKINEETGCWEWQKGKSPDGYGKIKHENTTWRVHRLVWTMVTGIFPGNLFVCHTCDNIICANPEHLFLGTHTANMTDMYRKGRGPTGNKNGTHTKPETRARGETAGNSKLTENIVREIRRNYNPRTMGARYFAQKYGVNASTIRIIVRNKTWKHIEV